MDEQKMPQWLNDTISTLPWQGQAHHFMEWEHEMQTHCTWDDAVPDSAQCNSCGHTFETTEDFEMHFEGAS